jgi:peptidoglycan/LPS O-acetylase OafA/YrhL
MRRVLRIFPLYYLTLFALLLVAAAAPRWVMFNGIRSWPEQLAYVFYLQNWLPVLKGSRYVSAIPIGHFWSLAVEEQFYLVWPWLVWWLAPRTVVRLCIAGCVAALLLRVILVSHFGPHLWIHMLTATRGEGLLVGSALAAVAATQECVPKRWLIALASAGTAIIGFILIYHPIELTDTDAGPYIYTIGISGFALLFGALVGSSSYFIPLLTPFLNQGGLKRWGKYSYGIYVYHLPIYVAIFAGLKKFGVRFPLQIQYSVVLTCAELALTYAVAWVSDTFLENKLLRLKRFWEPDVRTGVPFPEPPAKEFSSQLAGNFSS